MIRRLYASQDAQRGVASVELAMVLGILLTIIFGVLEVARAIYLINTLQEVTRRAAAGAARADFSVSTTLDGIRYAAIFRNSPGLLALGKPVSDEHILIDYLAQTREADGDLTLAPIAPSNLPSSPASNKRTCMADPHDASCIRFVRVRICTVGSGSACQPVPYQTLVSLVSLPFSLPRSTTIVPAESLGFVVGTVPGE